MAISLSVFLAQLDGLISADNNELSELRRSRLIKAAMEEYSIDRPDISVDDVTGDAGRYYPLTGSGAILSSWVDGFSRILSVEYPAATIASDEEPQLLEPEDWQDDYWYNGSCQLYFGSHAPSASEKMRIKYTHPYAWTVSATSVSVTQAGHGFVVNDYVYLDGTVWYKATDQRIATHRVSVAATDTFTALILQVDPPVTDFFAICHLAAAKCCQSLATKYSRTSDSSIRADSVDHISRGREFANRAKEFLTLYRDHMGLNKETEKAYETAGEFIDWDTAPSLYTGLRLFHKGK